MGDDTRTETVYDNGWLEYLKHTNQLHIKNQDDIEVPDYFVTSQDINPFDKVDIIAEWQKNIDTAISNTTNLPIDFSYEEYKKLYMYAYDKELKGITTYWEGGNLAPILTTKKKDEKVDDDRPTAIIRTTSPKRPESLDCDIHHVKVKDEHFIVLVGRLEDGSIYEVFADSHDAGYGDYTTGRISKYGKRRYDLVI